MFQVIDTFQLKISEDKLMSRCTKCNGRFIQKPLTLDEAIEASKGFQIIPSCLFKRNLEFWKCTDCNQLYWEVLIGSCFPNYPYSLSCIQLILDIHRVLNTTMQFRSFCQYATLATEERNTNIYYCRITEECQAAETV